jgi:hypothetical protein
MPTVYPKCSPSEMMGLLMLLNDHGGEEDLARLGDDLDLEIDEILPSSDFAEALQLVKVKDGRMAFTDAGRKLVALSIRDRKDLLREQIKRTTLFRTLVRALESSPEQHLSEEQVQQLIGLTIPSADAALLNIINWGRFVGLFRFDPDARILEPVRARRTQRAPTPPAGRPPSGGPAEPPTPVGKAVASAPASNPAKAASVLSGTPEVSPPAFAPLARRRT